MENYFAAIRLLLITILSFWWVTTIKDNLRKLFYILLASFIYIYCGLGIGYDRLTHYDYEITYFIYISVLGLSLRFFYKRNVHININNSVNIFSEKFSIVIIIVYFAMLLIPMVQAGIINRLVNPPTVNLIDNFESRDFNVNVLSGIFESLRNFIRPLFLLALYRYVKKPLIALTLYLFTYYIGYCTNEYMGRAEMATIFLNVFLYIFLYFPSKRKLLVGISLALIPVVIIFFAAFVDIRLGHSTDITDISGALNYLLESETNYWHWYNKLTGETLYIINYIVWFITLPLPGFLKPFDLNFNFTVLFTMDVLGFNSPNDVNSIALPGLVNESVFIFGKFFFFIHAIIFAWVFSMVYNSLIINKRNFFPLISCMLILSVQTGRGGSIGPYSEALKLLFVFWLFYIFSSKTKTIHN